MNLGKTVRGGNINDRYKSIYIIGPKSMSLEINIKILNG